MVRLWREQQAPAHAWRDSVEHVSSNRRYHSNLPGLIDFIKLRLAEDG